MTATATGSGRLTAVATIITYPEKLLTTASKLHSEGEYGIAVVVAHMACEILVARMLTRRFAARGMGDMEEAIEALLPGHNLSNSRVLTLFTAATGIKVNDQPFWKEFKESATRRNKAVHEGRIITKDQAGSSLEATRAFVDYLLLAP